MQIMFAYSEVFIFTSTTSLTLSLGLQFIYTKQGYIKKHTL